MESKEYVLNKMREVGLNAAASFQEQAPEMDGTQIIDKEESIPDFNPELHQYLNWNKGECVRDNDQVWQLLQPYDSNTYKEHPENLRAQWSLCHTKNPLKAKPYVEPMGQSGMYMIDECCIASDGKVYKSKVDNNVWEPTGYPTGWEEVTL
ncbi:hypothetical protein [Anaerofustis butyriciformans]|uniref:hypothetical protein n=1 Tax=Anaerofustis butyriciformans TaxID=3108533 RepID=UPI002E337DC2|nr:hypothetical protein [Anaerofustis sp. HA2171]